MIGEGLSGNLLHRRRLPGIVAMVQHGAD